MTRPTVSVVVPFAGREEELTRLVSALQRLRIATEDEVIVADNRPEARAVHRDGVAILDASGVSTPAFARNQGALMAKGEWLVFCDADTVPAPSLIEDYFAAEPAATTAVLAGEVVDIAQRPTVTARHGAARSRMSQRRTLDREFRAYAQTANCAVRRAAFERVGGFAEMARAGEDADLCFRLRDAGWRIEERSAAVVEHRSRDTPAQLLRQLAIHGSGAAWLNRQYPGTFPPLPATELARRLVRGAKQAIAAAWRRDGEDAAFALLDLAGMCAFELGRLLPNSPRPRR